MTWLVCAKRIVAAVCLGMLLGGCLPAGHSQLDEEKESHYLAGKSRVSSMDYRGAIEAFSKAVEVNPRSGAAHLELGWLYDQKETDPAAAIYHYNKYLQLRRNAPNAETIKTRILACKQELARTVSLGPVTQNLQREFEALVLANRKLQEDLEKWRAYALVLQTLTNAPRQVSPPETQPTATPPSAVATTPTQPAPFVATSQPAQRFRTHVVKQGETATQIAKRYGVRVDALLAANPRLDPTRMQIGDTIRIP
jgi:LysM repeat protein